MATQSIWLFVLLVSLQIADAWLTVRILAERAGRELNPVMRWIFDRLGVIPGLATAKLLLLALVLVALPVLPPWVLAALCGVTWSWSSSTGASCTDDGRGQE